MCMKDMNTFFDPHPHPTPTQFGCLASHPGGVFFLQHFFYPTAC